MFETIKKFFGAIKDDLCQKGRLEYVVNRIPVQGGGYVEELKPVYVPIPKPSPKDVVDMRVIGIKKKEIKTETGTSYCSCATVEYTYRDGSTKIVTEGEE